MGVGLFHKNCEWNRSFQFFLELNIENDNTWVDLKNELHHKLKVTNQFKFCEPSKKPYVYALSILS